jgi:hypothetical protein
MRAFLVACAVVWAVAGARADTVTVGGKEKQALYPFRCC